MAVSKMQLVCPLPLAGAMVVAPVAGRVVMEVPMCLGAALACLACAGTQVALVLNEVKPFEKHFGPLAVYN